MFSLTYALRGFQDRTAQVFDVTVANLTERRPCPCFLLGQPVRALWSTCEATGTSVRTLQRRLKDAGVNYSDLQNDVRKTLALNLLENETLALAEIAFSLGYSEVSAFNHAFRRWGRPIAGRLSSTTGGSFRIRRS
jgi:AraC-like DNA-binding protein